MTRAAGSASSDATVAAADRAPRFAVAAAGLVGFLLPCLETLRRGLGHWLVETSTMLEDYVAGGLLLAGAALAASRGGLVLLGVAWAYTTGMMSSSFFYQLEATLRGTETEPWNGVVLAFKAALWGTAVVSAVLVARALARPATA